ncbi:GAF domain-containing protein [Candidatus Cetobacterium colombiensis]|uniref:GAF domain-containing protein n=1 Tax=Candidatus Cetobacterium colombiensis TaxID=3073100 RepID=A0ABU4W620_9FUSO|nr:GAF domain-containing protein [Candidatus Cetobacterium colombiensis]MDX8334949.1 GAF domain-containing protein [Candidatus Cetobacterium colombiensis]
MKKNFFVNILESLIYCLLVYLVFFYYSNFKNDFLTMNIQPLTIVVGVMALKYGVYTSLQTVIIASFFYIFSYYKLGNDPVVFFLDFNYYKFILIFFFIGLTLGRVSDNFRSKIDELKEENKNLEETLKNQREKNLQLVNINERLKSRIIGSKESILTLHQLTSSILLQNVDKIFTQVLEILIDFLGSDVISIYLYNEERKIFRARIKIGNSVIPNFIEIKAGDIYSKVLDLKTVQCGNKEENKASPVYVAPILKNNNVIGIINIERLKYENQEKYLLELFKVISQWINNALVKAFEENEIEIKKNVFENTRIYNLKYFSQILEEDKKRKKKFGADYIALETINPGLEPEELNELIKGKMRDIDVIGMSDEVIKFIFVNASKDDKLLLIKRMSEMLSGAELYEI